MSPLQGDGLSDQPARKPIKKDTHLVGRRMWKLARDHERWRLTNIAHATEAYWPRGVYEATCRNWRQHSDRGPSPHASCRCGMYGFWNMEELAKQYHAGMVTGVVYAWGHVLPGREGFKAQFMQPIALDYPVCQGINSAAFRGGLTEYAGAPKRYEDIVGLCENPVEWAYIGAPEYVGDYPQPGDEDWEVGYEWVDLRAAPQWYCAEHLKGRWYRDTREAFRVRAEDIFHDLSVYYELEVWPPLDFPVLWDGVEPKEGAG